MQRDHSRERGIPFLISREFFECFCRIYGLLDSGDRNHRDGLTIDRINPDREAAPFFGTYMPGNVQVMTRAKNAEKRWKSDAIRYSKGYSWNGGYCPEPEDSILPDNPESL